MMATKILLPVTLGFLLLVLAAHGEEDTPKAVVVFKGIARCKSNSSRIISNAPLVMVIGNATIPGAGRTTSTGHIMMTVNLTSTEQVASLLTSNNGSRSKAFLIAPPHACGAPSIPPGTEVAAAVHVHPRRTTTSINTMDAVAEKFACIVVGGLLGAINPTPVNK